LDTIDIYDHPLHIVGTLEPELSMPELIRWTLFDTLTGITRGVYASRRRAQAAADRKDLEYGAVRYVVRALAVVEA